MNLTYVTESGTPVDPSAVQKLVQSELGSSIKGLGNVNVTIQPEDSKSP
jgi:hypothetical protein